MTIKIGSNIASIQAQRRLGEATSSLGKIYERLSSGQRINRASDDAAGLAIADDLQAKGRIYTQAIRNANDGISLLNIADSANSALTAVVTRMRELSEQSANGSYSSTQRNAMDSEAQALSVEFNRILQSTSFNGLKLLDGSLTAGIRLQLGSGIENSMLIDINTSFGGAVGTGSFGTASSITTENSLSQALALGDLNGDGILDMVSAGFDGVRGKATVRLGLGDGSFGAATSYSTESSTSYALALGDLNNDGYLDLVTAGIGTGGKATIRLGTGTGTFGAAVSYTTEGTLSYAVSLGDLNGDGFLDLVTAGYDGVSGKATVRLGTGTGSFGSAFSYTTETTRSFGLTLGDLNGDNILDLITAGIGSGGKATIRLGIGDGLFGDSFTYTTEGSQSRAVTLGDLNNDGILDLITAGRINASDGAATVRLGTGSGFFGSAVSYSMEGDYSRAVALGDLNGDGYLDLITSGNDNAGGNKGYATVRLGTGSGSFGEATSYTAESVISYALALGDLDGDNILDMLTAGNDAGHYAHIRLGESDGSASISDFSLRTQADSRQAMSMLDRTLETLAGQRGTIGAAQSRVGIAIQNLQSARENFAAAEARIRDADIAAEAANLLRTQILQQAAVSVLSQANQAPALALQLLR